MERQKTWAIEIKIPGIRIFFKVYRNVKKEGRFSKLSMEWNSPV